MRRLTLLPLLLFFVACQRAPTETLGVGDESWQATMSADVEPCTNGDCPPPDDGCTNGNCPPPDDGCTNGDCPPPDDGCTNGDCPSPNQPPVADANGPYTGAEGLPIPLDGSGSYDPDADPLTYAWDFGDGNTGSGPTPSNTYADNGQYDVCLSVTDDGGLSDTQCTTANIANVAPTCGPITILPADLVQVGTPISASGTYSDPGTNDTHDALWDWDDGDTDPGTAGSGAVGPDGHTYSTAGVYGVSLTVTDDDGGMCVEPYQYVVVYDPSGGFVTGGGWIDSPAGAYMPEPLLTGKATFGFVSKYEKGASVPTGKTEFQFKAGDLNFHSSSYDWLVVTGSDHAKFKGSGTINGMGDYRFMLWAGDDAPDTFRIRIWTEDQAGIETDVYDNGFDQEIGGGSIVIHTKK
ncbi:MAG: PKD domain-containing protein [Gemmatimonadales bacterium]